MFKLRLISAIILVPLVVLGILYLPFTYIAILSAGVFAIAAWEWLHMTVLKKSWIRFLLLIMLVVVAYSVLSIGIESAWIYWCALIWWSFAFIGVCYYPNAANLWKDILIQPFIALLLFIPAWLSFNTMLQNYQHGRIWVLLGCVLIWGSDIGAYICGKLWGKTKLIPAVSPGKTWAGLYGAIATGFIITLLFYFIFKPPLALVHLLWVATMTIIFAVIGDLVESMFKRIYGVKDSGKLIPGHGGMFDRIDSMLAAFPIYYLGLQNLFNLRIMAL